MDLGLPEAAILTHEKIIEEVSPLDSDSTITDIRAHFQSAKANTNIGVAERAYFAALGKFVTRIFADVKLGKPLYFGIVWAWRFSELPTLQVSAEYLMLMRSRFDILVNIMLVDEKLVDRIPSREDLTEIFAMYSREITRLMSRAEQMGHQSAESLLKSQVRVRPVRVEPPKVDSSIGFPITDRMPKAMRTYTHSFAPLHWLYSQLHDVERNRPKREQFFRDVGVSPDIAFNDPRFKEWSLNDQSVLFRDFCVMLSKNIDPSFLFGVGDSREDAGGFFLMDSTTVSNVGSCVIKVMIETDEGYSEHVLRGARFEDTTRAYQMFIGRAIVNHNDLVVELLRFENVTLTSIELENRAIYATSEDYSVIVLGTSPERIELALLQRGRMARGPDFGSGTLSMVNHRLASLVARFFNATFRTTDMHGKQVGKIIVAMSHASSSDLPHYNKALDLPTEGELSIYDPYAIRTYEYLISCVAGLRNESPFIARIVPRKAEQIIFNANGEDIVVSADPIVTYPKRVALVVTRMHNASDVIDYFMRIAKSGNFYASV
jgi:hypothetical protein